MAFRPSRILKFRLFNHEFVKQTKDTINTYDRYRMSNYPKIPVFRTFTGVLCVGGVSLAIYTVFKHPIRKYFSKEGSAVATDIIKSPEVHKSVKSGISNLTEDKEIADKLKVFLQENLTQMIEEKWFSDLLKASGGKLVKELSVDEEINNMLAGMFVSLFAREDIQNNLAKMFTDIFAREDVVNGLNKLIMDGCKDPSNQDEMAASMKAVMARDDVRNEVAKMMRSASYKFVFGVKS